MKDRAKRDLRYKEKRFSWGSGEGGEPGSQSTRSPLTLANREGGDSPRLGMAVSFTSTGYNTRSAKKKLTNGMDMDSETPDEKNEDEQSWAVPVTTRSRAAHAAQAAGAGENDEGGDGGMVLDDEGQRGRSGPRTESRDAWGQKRTHTDEGGQQIAAQAGGERGDEGGARGRGKKRNPVEKLTVALLNTYQEINEKYYAKHKSQCNDGYDDENGDYVIRQGDMINDRYEVSNRPGSKSPLLGKGSFGQVVYAIDRRSPQPQTEVALKIIKNHRHWHEQAKSEIELLRKFTKVPGKWGDNDWVDYSNVVRLLDDFVFRSHCCLVFELLPFTLYDLLKYSRFKGVSLTLVRKFAYNLIRTLDCLRHPSIDVIHCDLKPENVMLVKYNEHRVKVIDFGSSCSSKRQPFTYIQSRFYRAPEVLLCRPYGHAIDMWSLGCILVEMHMGQPLFNGKNELQQMIKICDVLGMPPQHMLRQAGSKSKVRSLFREQGSDELVLLVDDKVLDPLPSKSFAKLIRKPMPVPHTAEEARMYDLFEDLLLKMLTYDPNKRITPAEALKHTFFGRKDATADPKLEKMHLSPRAESSDGEGGGSSPLSRAPRERRDANVSLPQGEGGGSSTDRRRWNKVDQEVQTGEPGFLKSLAPSSSRAPQSGAPGAAI